MINKRGEIIVVAVFVLVVVVISFVTYFYFKEKNQTDITNTSAVNQTPSVIVNQTNSDNITDQNETLAGGNLTDDNFSEVEEIHWDHMPISYKINDKTKCLDKPIEKLEEAFGLIEEATSGGVSFVKNSSKADIEINCIDAAALLNSLNASVKCDKKTFDYVKDIIDPLREGFIDENDYLINVSEVSMNVSVNFTETVYEICFLNGDDASIAAKVGLLHESMPELNGNVVVSHKINIYKTGPGQVVCSGIPAREIHEIFHSFGFAHSEEPRYDPYYGWADSDIHYLSDIMFSTLFCRYQKKIDEKYISCLNKIYSNQTGDCKEVKFIDLG